MLRGHEEPALAEKPACLGSMLMQVGGMCILFLTAAAVQSVQLSVLLVSFCLPQGLHTWKGRILVPGALTPLKAQLPH